MATSQEVFERFTAAKRIPVPRLQRAPNPAQQEDDMSIMATSYSLVGAAGPIIAFSGAPDALGDTNPGGNETVAEYVMPRKVRLRNLKFKVSVDFTFTVGIPVVLRKNGVDTTLTASLSAAGEIINVAGEVIYNAGDRLSFRYSIPAQDTKTARGTLSYELVPA